MRLRGRGTRTIIVGIIPAIRIITTQPNNKTPNKKSTTYKIKDIHNNNNNAKTKGNANHHKNTKENHKCKTQAHTNK